MMYFSMWSCTLKTLMCMNDYDNGEDIFSNIEVKLVQQIVVNKYYLACSLHQLWLLNVWVKIFLVVTKNVNRLKCINHVCHLFGNMRYLFVCSCGGLQWALLRKFHIRYSLTEILLETTGIFKKCPFHNFIESLTFYKKVGSYCSDFLQGLQSHKKY